MHMLRGQEERNLPAEMRVVREEALEFGALVR